MNLFSQFSGSCEPVDDTSIWFIMCFVFTESWINFNDSRVKFTAIEDVLLSQAYILIYKRQGEELATPIEKEEITMSIDSPEPSCSLKKETSQKIDEDITFNFKTPTLDSSQTLKRSNSDTPFRIIKRRRSTLR